MKEVRFSNTKTAFAMYSDKDLWRAYLIYKTVSYKYLVDVGARLTTFGLKIGLPLSPLIKVSIYKQFCAGENFAEAGLRVDQLASFNVGTVLDYAVEHCEDPREHRATADTVSKIIDFSHSHSGVEFSVLKLTALFDPALLEKFSKGLSSDEETRWKKSENLFYELCKKATDLGLPLLVDAEESWYQDAIDTLTESAMAKFNTHDQACIFQTVQLYRVDRLAYLKSLTEKSALEGKRIGVKLVRGAYMDKENRIAMDEGRSSPIHRTKAATDNAFDEGMEWCLAHLGRISVFIGTHNQNSCERAMVFMRSKKIASDDPRVFFSQLYGMSDHLSFNLAAAGYKALKYTPFGPVKKTLPYLLRRAEENTSIQGQMGRELRLISQEIERRKAER